MKKKLINRALPAQVRLKKFLLIMRLTILLCFTIITSLNASVYSQDAKLGLELKGKTISDAFEFIESNSNFRFFYNADFKDINRKIEFSTKDADIESMLNGLFADSNISYEIVGGNLIVLKVNSQQANLSVSGKVVDKNGMALPGVTIVVKGTTQGTVTNADGVYSISNVPKDAILLFSFVGMKMQEIKVGNQTTINITMEANAIGIEEVVAIGYGTMKKSDLTGSIGSIGSDEISTRPVMSFDQSLQGRVAGVNVSQLNSEPGQTSTVRIRGGNSLSASNNPLWVVDGYPVENLSMFNPSDIESMEILKDASATAIYGSRGANGVIIVTTKRGQTGKPSIEFNSYVGFSSAVNMPELADCDLYLDVYEEVLGNSASIEEPWRSANTDWLKLAYGGTGITQNYQLSVRGGTERAQYAIGGSYLEQTGTTPNIGFNRSTFSLRHDSEITSKLKIGSSTILSRTSNYGKRPQNHIIEALPTMLNKDENGDYVPVEDYPYVYAESHVANYLQTVEEETNDVTRYRVLSNMFVNWEIIKGLVFRTSWGIDYYNENSESYTPSYLTDNDLSQGNINHQETIDWLNENTLTFDKNVNEIHEFNAVVGFTQQSNMLKERDMQGENFLNDALGIEGISAAEVQYITTGRQRWDLLSGIARVNYRLKQKYLFTAAIRADGCSKFGENNKWGYFPSGAFAWRASEENFIKNINVFSNLKFRLSYGMTGNQGISPYQSLSKISTSVTFLNDTEVIAAYPSSPPYKDLRWEKTAQTDIGIDMAFFDSKLDFTADYYIKKTSDLLIDVPLPLTAGGEKFLTQNLGDLENKGFEFGINTHLNINKLRWDIGLVFSANKNTVTNIEGRDDYWVQGVSQMGDFLKIEEGEPVGNIWGYQTDGIYQTNDDFSIADSEPGNIKFIDQNGDKEITADDRVILGNAMPDFIAGLNMDFFYQNFELNLSFNSAVGNDLVNVNWAKWETPNPSANFLAEAGRERWREDAPSNKYPKSASGYNQGQKVSDRIVEDASFLRLQNLRFAYRFPVKSISWLQNVTLYVNGQNLFCITNYRGFDPEVSTTGSDVLSLGGDYNAYPTTRTYTIGLNVKF
ncbi:TonB-dependent receptor [Maribellus maritimus]|uniref:TonB-dependent receptor n=1 Tax=Maribellus maritimus TaxID=2870838 RepID=UPI001EEBDBE8|nr:TonB-dependent receptor [Maribellus maritimus]MCG6191013.1 TonB-dependent receptor [Maribellus maritimus]